MPWEILSLSVDARLFGLTPAAFYAHQLLTMALLVVVLDLVLRRFLTPVPRAVALVLVVASTPFYAIARQLMNRHYAEGAILALLALLLALRAFASDRLAPALLGAGAYLLATTAKEVFVPGVLLLPLVPVGDLRVRLRRSLPFFAAAGFYAAWRLAMLGPGNSFGGYGIHPARFGWRALPAAAGFAAPWTALAAAAAVLAAVAVLAGTSLRRWSIAAAVALVLVLPLASILPELAPRHFFLPAIAAATALAGALEALRGRLGERRVAAAGAVLAVLALAAALGSPFPSRLARGAAHQRAEGAFVLGSDDGGVLLTSLPDPRFLVCLAELRRDVLGKGPGPRFCGDACWCGPRLAGLPAWRFERGRLLDAGVLEPSDCAVRRALDVEMRYDPHRGRLAWRLGPYTEGDYEVILLSGGDPPDVSRPAPIVPEADLPMTLDRPLSLVIAYRSPEGWRTYSDVLTIDPGSNPQDDVETFRSETLDVDVESRGNP